MTQPLLLVPLSSNVGLKTVSLGLLSALRAQAIKTDFFLPIRQPIDTEWEHLGTVFAHYQIEPQTPIEFEEVVQYLGRGRIGKQILLEHIVERFFALPENDFLVIQGVKVDLQRPFLFQLNIELAQALNAQVILVAVGEDATDTALADQIKIAANLFGDLPNERVIGCIINKATSCLESLTKLIPVIGCIPQLEYFSQTVDEIDQEIVESFDQRWISSLKQQQGLKRTPPPQFIATVSHLARQANKRIVLPEGNDARTIKAAILCAREKIARCVLLGNPDEIHQIACEEECAFTDEIEIINPEIVRQDYVEPMIELRKTRQLTTQDALTLLEDNVYVGTMMLHLGEVDGLVSGAVHTTANTVRPAFQLIKTSQGSTIISSTFFMCLPNQVLLYADCAINPKPTVEMLAEIAIQSSDTALAFGIKPYVAMISYSTGTSGAGTDVQKIRDAVEIVKAKRPDVSIDGPIQYDAAVNSAIAQRKAPESPVGGKATVCVFPDLDTGNAVYKAVQQSTQILSLGPVLQGVRKPVNDLSRGCSTEDIIYTIAITAVQATHNKVSE